MTVIVACWVADAGLSGHFVTLYSIVKHHSDAFNQKGTVVVAEHLRNKGLKASATCSYANIWVKGIKDCTRMSFHELWMIKPVPAKLTQNISVTGVVQSKGMVQQEKIRCNHRLI